VHPGTKIAEVRVNKIAANIVGTLLTILFCGAGVLFAHMLPHYVPFAEWHFPALLASLMILVPIHEALHALGLRVYGNVEWRDIKFGVMWRALMPYCHCTVSIPVGACRRMALLPLWVTGTATVAALLIFPTDAVGILAGVAVAACVGDVWVAMKLRRFADDLLVKDSPTEIGCDVFSTIPESVV
jgi:hypothetical protein